MRRFAPRASRARERDPGSRVGSENLRQWVHIGSAGFALLLRTLTWWEAAALAGAALLFNAFALPRVGGRHLYRPADEARGFPLGILLYPAAVLLLILAFPGRLDIAAAAWGVMAFGDGFATLAGRRWRGRAWPWNSEKTIAGTAAFVCFGGAGAAALACWTRPAILPEPALAYEVLAPVAAAVVAGLVETMPVRLDDNVSVPATAAIVLWLGTLVAPEALHAALGGVVGALPWAAGLNVALAWLAYRARTVSTMGAIVGALIGLIIYAAAGPGAWMLLFVTFATASAVSRVGLQRKMLMGIAEERGGRRGAGNAIANCGVAAIAAAAAAATPHPAAARLALAAALIAGGSDTVASELGKVWGGSTVLVISLRRVKPGTPGGMSLEGTAAGLLAAFGLAALAAWFGEITRAAIGAVVIASMAGALVESVLGATLEPAGILNNHMLNFINTAVAAAAAIALG